MTTQRKVGVLGAGSWGTALASLASRAGNAVTLWGYEAEVVQGIRTQHVNPLYLPEVPLPEDVVATQELPQAVAGQDLLLLVLPAQHVRSYIKQLAHMLPAAAPLVLCSKGIERHTLATMDQVLTEELPQALHANIAVLSGPSFALEVARGVPTNVTAASRDLKVAKLVQATLSTRAFRIYTSEDVIGVELGGALKNVIAIAVGASDGLGFGNNTRAGIITRGLAEVTRLAVSMGARPETLLGLAGVGDLILTCTGDLSRNRHMGQLLASGKSPTDILKEMRMIAEGVPTAESAYQLGLRQGVELPITEQVYRVLYEGQKVTTAMAALQDRSLKEEWQS